MAVTDWFFWSLEGIEQSRSRKVSEWNLDNSTSFNFNNFSIKQKKKQFDEGNTGCVCVCVTYICHNDDRYGCTSYLSKLLIALLLIIAAANCEWALDTCTYNTFCLIRRREWFVYDTTIIFLLSSIHPSLRVFSLPNYYNYYLHWKICKASAPTLQCNQTN